MSFKRNESFVISYADNNERSYQDLKGQGQSDAKIFVDSKGINYVDSQGVDYSTRDNFYIVGSLANAELSNYAPTFKIEEHAEVYQYTTLNKLTKYGEGFQNASDTSILNTQDSDDLYIYVPYVEKESGSIEIFLIRESLVMVILNLPKDPVPEKTVPSLLLDSCSKLFCSESLFRISINISANAF